LVLAVLVFVPIRYVYPTKTKFLKSLTLVGGAFWALTLIWLMLNFEQPNPAGIAVSLVYPVYYFVLSLYLHFRHAR
jgi:phosphatidylcholine synthase